MAKFKVQLIVTCSTCSAASTAHGEVSREGHLWIDLPDDWESVMPDGEVMCRECYSVHSGEPIR